MKIYWENEIEELDTSKELNFERIYIYIILNILRNFEVFEVREYLTRVSEKSPI